MITSRMKQKFIIDVNPSTGEIIEKIKCSSPGEIGSAVKIARKASKIWAETSVKTRVAIFKKISKSIRASADDVACTITREMGKPIRLAREEVADAIKKMELIISFTEASLGKEVFKNGNETSEVVFTPYGVAGVICSWNYPFLTPSEYLSSAIITGNTTILKPSEITPCTGTKLYNLFNAELPKGVINIVQGAGEVCECLLNSDINILSFVGPKDKGKRVISSSVERMQRYVMELSSKDAMIVTDDANLTEAARFAVRNSFNNSGQKSNSIERIYVQNQVYEKFVKNILEIVEKVKIGDPFNEVDVGPLATEEMRNKVLVQLEEARRKGAKIIFGGGKPERAGFFLEATVIIDVNDKYELMCDETFGPVIAIQKYNDLEIVIDKINKSPFGSGATVWSRNTKKADYIARKIEVGMVGINTSTDGVSGSPRCSIKQSGCGYMGCKESLRLFTYPKKYTY